MTPWLHGVNRRMDDRPDLFVVNGMVTGKNPKERELDFFSAEVTGTAGARRLPHGRPRHCPLALRPDDRQPRRPRRPAFAAGTRELTSKGDGMENIVVVTMSEFGRTAHENGNRAPCLPSSPGVCSARGFLQKKKGR